ncbi:rho GTPase-activating protein 19-like [Osmerus eperlanus]|uniref:rho GTPase-activating protein 19-like n=1 Tax=Osmerus eperlanus TaxID=29151 RepID=UPI002E0E048A
MAAEKVPKYDTQNRRGMVCSVAISVESPVNRRPIIFNPDFFVERLRHERPQAFTELVLSNITRLIDLPGDEFAQLTGEAEPRLPAPAGGFLRSLNFLKRKEKGMVFGSSLTEEGIAQIYQLIDYLSKNLHVEGLFRVPGHSVRQAALREMLNTGAEIDLETGAFHPNDVASLLKAFLGELPEPLLTHRHYHAHLKIAELTQFDQQGNKTGVPDKERQIQAFQLLFMLLPAPNRSLLKLLLDLLYHTARKQHANKMSALNLATMFTPHVLWPRSLTASDLQGNIKKLNDGVAFLIKHSQKLFRAPVYIKEYARLYFTGSNTLLAKGGEGEAGGGEVCGSSHTEVALRELYQQVSTMPESAKKKQLIRQFEKQIPGTPVCDTQTPPHSRKQHHRRSRSFGGIIKRRVLGGQGSSSLETPGPRVPAESRGKENNSFTGKPLSLKRIFLSPDQRETSV